MDNEIFAGLIKGPDGIYGYDFVNTTQTDEIAMRTGIAAEPGAELDIITRHHSIPVMDREVRIFLDSIPENGTIIDIGGCWGWHWRHINMVRPDLTVVIVDLVRENLKRAGRLLGEKVGRSILLVHGDACDLRFPDNSFDGYWSAQTLQHIPDFAGAVSEARRILKTGGAFSCYMINDAALVRYIYRAARKPYHVYGNVPGSFYLSRGTAEHGKIIEKIFSSNVRTRFSEVFFQPELKFILSGRESSLMGKADSLVSGRWALPFLARQRSFHTVKT